MQYDPVKRTIGLLVRHTVLFRKTLYALLGLLFLREWYIKRELRRIFRSAAPPHRVFDAGSGFGQYSYYCAKHFPGVEILAVDVKEEQIEDCRDFFRKAGISGIQFAVQDLNRAVHEGAFDLVLSIDVMEHIPDDVGVFRNFHRALRSGGILLIDTPSDLGGSDAHSPGDESFIGEHVRNGYGAEEIRAKLATAGFVVESIRFSYGSYGSLAWRLGIKYPMIMLNTNMSLMLLLPFYYAIALPFVLPLMYLDYRKENREGTGLVVVARKP